MGFWILHFDRHLSAYYLYTWSYDVIHILIFIHLANVSSRPGMLHPTVQTNTLNLQITLLRADRSINLQVANRNFIHCIFCFGNIHTDVISIIILARILETKLCFRKSISKRSKAKLITNIVSRLVLKKYGKGMP